MELRCRFLPAPRSDGDRVFRRACTTTRFGVGLFKSNQGFSGDDRGPGVLVLRGTSMKTFQLSSIRSGQLRYGSSDFGASMARFDDSGRRMVHGP